MTSQDIIKAVAKELKYYIEVKRKENDFDTNTAKLGSLASEPKTLKPDDSLWPSKETIPLGRQSAAKDNSAISLLNIVAPGKLTRGEAERLISTASKLIVATETVLLPNHLRSKSEPRSTSRFPHLEKKDIRYARNENEERNNLSKSRCVVLDKNGRKMAVKNSLGGITNSFDSDYDSFTSNIPTNNDGERSAPIPEWLRHEMSKVQIGNDEISKVIVNEDNSTNNRLQKRPMTAHVWSVNARLRRRARLLGDNLSIAATLASEDAEPKLLREDVGVQTETCLFPIVVNGPRTRYKIEVHTGDKLGAGTRAKIYLTIRGNRGRCDQLLLDNSLNHQVKFKRGQTDIFDFELPYLGQLESITIGHRKKDIRYSWYLHSVDITDCNCNIVYLFSCHQWLSAEMGPKQTLRDLSVADIKELPSDSDSEGPGDSSETECLYAADDESARQSVELPDNDFPQQSTTPSLIANCSITTDDDSERSGTEHLLYAPSPQIEDKSTSSSISPIENNNRRRKSHIVMLTHNDQIVNEVAINLPKEMRNQNFETLDKSIKENMKNVSKNFPIKEITHAEIIDCSKRDSLTDESYTESCSFKNLNIKSADMSPKDLNAQITNKCTNIADPHVEETAEVKSYKINIPEEVGASNIEVINEIIASKKIENDTRFELIDNESENVIDELTPKKSNSEIETDKEISRNKEIEEIAKEGILAEKMPAEILNIELPWENEGSEKESPEEENQPSIGENFNKEIFDNMRKSESNLFTDNSEDISIPENLDCVKKCKETFDTETSVKNFDKDIQNEEERLEKSYELTESNVLIQEMQPNEIPSEEQSMFSNEDEIKISKEEEIFQICEEITTDGKDPDSYTLSNDKEIIFKGSVYNIINENEVICERDNSNNESEMKDEEEIKTSKNDEQDISRSIPSVTSEGNQILCENDIIDKENEMNGQAGIKMSEDDEKTISDSISNDKDISDNENEMNNDAKAIFKNNIKDVSNHHIKENKTLNENHISGNEMNDEEKTKVSLDNKHVIPNSVSHNIIEEKKILSEKGDNNHGNEIVITSMGKNQENMYEDKIDTTDILENDCEYKAMKELVGKTNVIIERICLITSDDDISTPLDDTISIDKDLQGEATFLDEEVISKSSSGSQMHPEETFIKSDTKQKPHENDSIEKPLTMEVEDPVSSNNSNEEVILSVAEIDESSGLNENKNIIILESENKNKSNIFLAEERIGKSYIGNELTVGVHKDQLKDNLDNETEESPINEFAETNLSSSEFKSHFSITENEETIIKEGNESIDATTDDKVDEKVDLRAKELLLENNCNNLSNKSVSFHEIETNHKISQINHSDDYEMEDEKRNESIQMNDKNEREDKCINEDINIKKDLIKEEISEFLIMPTNTVELGIHNDINMYDNKKELSKEIINTNEVISPEYSLENEVKNEINQVKDNMLAKSNHVTNKDESKSEDSEVIINQNEAKKIVEKEKVTQCEIKSNDITNQNDSRNEKENEIIIEKKIIISQNEITKLEINSQEVHSDKTVNEKNSMEDNKYQNTINIDESFISKAEININNENLTSAETSSGEETFITRILDNEIVSKNEKSSDTITNTESMKSMLADNEIMDRNEMNNDKVDNKSEILLQSDVININEKDNHYANSSDELLQEIDQKSKKEITIEEYTSKKEVHKENVTKEEISEENSFNKEIFEENTTKRESSRKNSIEKEVYEENITEKEISEEKSIGKEVCEKNTIEKEVYEGDHNKKEIYEENTSNKEVYEGDHIKKDIYKENTSNRDICEENISLKEVYEEKIIEKKDYEENTTEKEIHEENATEKEVCKESIIKKEVSEENITEQKGVEEQNKLIQSVAKIESPSHEINTNQTFQNEALGSSHNEHNPLSESLQEHRRHMLEDLECDDDYWENMVNKDRDLLLIQKSDSVSLSHSGMGESDEENLHDNERLNQRHQQLQYRLNHMLNFSLEDGDEDYGIRKDSMSGSETFRIKKTPHSLTDLSEDSEDPRPQTALMNGHLGDDIDVDLHKALEDDLIKNTLDAASWHGSLDSEDHDVIFKPTSTKDKGIMVKAEVHRRNSDLSRETENSPFIDDHPLLQNGPGIHEATDQGDLNRVQALVAHYPRFKDAPDEKGWTPLHHAVAQEHLEVLQVLIKMGASLNSQSNDKETPLHLAVSRGQPELVEELILNGADVEKLDSSNRTPLDVAFERKNSAVINVFKETSLITKSPLNEHPEGGVFASTPAIAVDPLHSEGNSEISCG